MCVSDSNKMEADQASHAQDRRVAGVCVVRVRWWYLQQLGSLRLGRQQEERLDLLLTQPMA